MTKEERKAYMKDWRSKNPDYDKLSGRSYYRLHKEQMREYQKEYYKTHKEQIMKRQRERREREKQDERLRALFGVQ